MEIMDTKDTLLPYFLSQPARPLFLVSFQDLRKFYLLA